MSAGKVSLLVVAAVAAQGIVLLGMATAASATRSRVESRNAPNTPVVPLTRARAPSSMSAITKNVQTIVPANRWPVGISS